MWAKPKTLLVKMIGAHYPSVFILLKIYHYHHSLIYTTSIYDYDMIMIAMIYVMVILNKDNDIWMTVLIDMVLIEYLWW